MVKEPKAPVFIITSAFIFALFLSFYNFSFSLLLIFSIGIFVYSFFRKNFNLILWTGILLCFYLAGSFYFSKYFSQDKHFKREVELLTTIKKVEPYYSGYLNTAFSTSVGNFIFKTDKKYFSPGENCLITFQNIKPTEYLNPFSFEKRKILLVKGISSRMKFVREKGFICEKDRGFNLEKIRFRLLNFSEKLSGTARGLIQALVLGVEYNFPEEYKEKLKNQGLYHQLAISGFNLAILFGIFYYLFYNLLKFTPLIRTGYPLQSIAYLFALPGAFLILFLSGFCPSAFRAFVFLALFVFSKFFFRNTSSLILLFLTATLILIFQPYLIGNFSFQLSFVATLGLIIGDRIFKKYFKDVISSSNTLNRILSHLLHLFVVSIIVSVFVFPFIIYLNGTFPLATPVNNILATFFWSFIFIPGALLIALISFLSEGIAIKLANILAYIFDLYIKIPFFEFTYRFKIPVNLVILWLILSFIVFIFFHRVFRGYKKYFFCIIAVFMVYALLYFFYNRTFYILVFDVGKANAILVKNEDFNILIDTGPNYFKNFNWTNHYLVPVLNKLGVDVIDLIIVSHPDLDHSGGLGTMRKYFYVKKVVSGNFKAEDWEKVNIFLYLKQLKSLRL